MSIVAPGQRRRNVPRLRNEIIFKMSSCLVGVLRRLDGADDVTLDRSFGGVAYFDGGG